MGSRYLTDLADVCRAAGLRVIEVGSGPSQVGDAWKSRSRSSGGYGSGQPSHIMVHHTASGPSSDGWGDVNYETFHSDSRPVANLGLARTGEVYVMAVGATNTNGQGHDSWGGGVPDDSMNTCAIGIEPGNDGVGEPWPQVQQEAYCTLVNALRAAYGIPVGHVRGHVEWAPGRKIDPAGQSRWAAGSATWNLDAFRGDVAVGWPGGPPPLPSPERKRMYSILTCEDGSWWATDMMQARWLSNGDQLTTYKNMLVVFGFNPNPNGTTPLAKVQQGEFGVPIGRVPWDPQQRDATGLNVWGHMVQAGGWPNAPASAYLVDGRVDANTAATYSQMAANNTKPPPGAADPLAAGEVVPVEPEAPKASKKG